MALLEFHIRQMHSGYVVQKKMLLCIAPYRNIENLNWIGFDIKLKRSN